MAERKVLIIGAGVAGLTAGCYLQMNGYPTTLFEMGRTPGGSCTAWKREGYLFDGCIDWLPGAIPYTPMHQYWLEVGALPDGKITRFTEYKKTEYAPGAFFSLYTDADWLSAELLRVAPADMRAIAGFIRVVKRVARTRDWRGQVRLLAGSSGWPGWLARLAAGSRIPAIYSNMTIAAYARRFRTPVLRARFAEWMAMSDEMPVAMLFVRAGWMHAGGAGYPTGGSLAFARAIETHFRRLGGKILYQRRVTQIRVENGRAVGITLANGETYDADIVISAADSYDTLYNMLAGRHVDAVRARRFGSPPGGGPPLREAPGRLCTPLIRVSLGVRHALRETAHTVSHLLARPLVIDDTHTATQLETRIYGQGGASVSSGKTTVAVSLPADYDYWCRLADADPLRYEAEKQRIGREVAAALAGTPGVGGGQAIAGLAGAVEVIDVMTPDMWQKKTNNYRASPRGWYPTPQALRQRLPHTLPHLRDFYHIGHWTVPGGGLPAVLWTSRQVTKAICRRDGRRFTIRT